MVSPLSSLSRRVEAVPSSKITKKTIESDSRLSGEANASSLQGAGCKEGMDQDRVGAVPKSDQSTTVNPLTPRPKGASLLVQTASPESASRHAEPRQTDSPVDSCRARLDVQGQDYPPLVNNVEKGIIAEPQGKR